MLREINANMERVLILAGCTNIRHLVVVNCG